MNTALADRIFEVNEDFRRARSALELHREVLLSIRRAPLPKRLPEIPGLELALHSIAADPFGSDFYDVLPLGDGRWVIAIADAGGQDFAPAAVAALAQNLRTGWRRQAQPSPGAILGQVNGLLARHLPDTGRYLTAFVALYDDRTRDLLYACAGHPPPRLVRSRKVVRLDAVCGPPLGLSETSVYDEAAVRLSPGDRLVLFTDGMTRALNAACESIGDPRFDAALTAPARSADDLVAHVVDRLRTFCDEELAQADETCLACFVKQTPAAARTSELFG